MTAPHLTPEDVARIMQLVAQMATEWQCSPREAINRLQGLARSAGSAIARRNVFDYARHIHHLRIRRDQKLGTHVFRDPAWDMVLDLLAAHDEQRDVAVSSLCMASGVPPTTALRHIERLEREDMIERSDDAQDHRRSLIRIHRDRMPQLIDMLDQFQS